MLRLAQGPAGPRQPRAWCQPKARRGHRIALRERDRRGHLASTATRLATNPTIRATTCAARSSAKSRVQQSNCSELRTDGLA